MGTKSIQEGGPKREAPEGNPYVSNISPSQAADLQTWPSHCLVDNTGHVLWILILQISESPPGQTTSDGTTLHAEHLFFQRGRNHPTHTHWPWICRLRFHHIWMPEERGKAQHGHTRIIRGFSTLSCAVCCRPGLAHLVLQRDGFSTQVSAYIRNGIVKHVTSTQVINALREVVGAIGKTCLGISKQEMGTHSIRSGAAMAMYLGKCQVYTIMLIGWWSSDAFLCYICKQVTQLAIMCQRRCCASRITSTFQTTTTG